MNKNISTIQQQAQNDLYDLAKDSITNNSLSVLITLLTIGVGLALLINRFSAFFSKNILPKLESYLTTQENFIKVISVNSEEIKKNLIVLENDTSTDHDKIINKLSTIEIDVKEIKILISKD